jgi:hypothetical protein
MLDIRIEPAIFFVALDLQWAAFILKLPHSTGVGKFIAKVVYLHEELAPEPRQTENSR